MLARFFFIQTVVNLGFVCLFVCLFFSVGHSNTHIIRHYLKKQPSKFLRGSNSCQMAVLINILFGIMCQGMLFVVIQHKINYYLLYTSCTIVYVSTKYRSKTSLDIQSPRENHATKDTLCC